MSGGEPRERRGRLACPCGRRLDRIAPTNQGLAWSIWRCKAGHLWAWAFHEGDPEWRPTWRRIATVTKIIAGGNGDSGGNAGDRAERTPPSPARSYAGREA